LAGDAVAGLSDEQQHDNIVSALRASATLADERGVTLLLEPLNTRVDHVGHYLDSTRHGLAIVEEVAAPNVRLLLDLYHAAVMEEELDEIVGDRMDLIGHVHVADAPGRHEPGTGRIEWRETLGWLQRSGYGGRLGLEYQPTGETVSSLSFVVDVMAN
jgi:hydroxypyruvate isomerase